MFSKIVRTARVPLMRAPMRMGCQVRTLKNIVTIEEAKQMPFAYNRMSNETLIINAVDGDYMAKRERLIRNIMVVDNIEWHEARDKVVTIVDFHRQGRNLLTVPYFTGIAAATSMALLSIPMIFHLDTVIWFNANYVTTEVPEAQDLETPLEVGSWAWNWMEPPLGQMSFFILCMQFARAQLQNISYSPYTEWVKGKRTQRLINQYPQYAPEVLADFGVADVFERNNPRDVSTY